MQHLVDLGPGVQAGFTTRWGGVSQGNYQERNFGSHVGDDPEAVAANRTALARELNASLVFTDQVHGTVVQNVTQQPTEWVTAGETGDAQVTMLENVALIVMVADCLPVLFADADARVIAVAHAGREGLRSGVIQEAVAAMELAGARRGAISAAVGPAICGQHYEVPADMAKEFAEQFTGCAVTTAWGSAGLDLRAAAHQVLQAEGVAQLTDLLHCTYEDSNYFSHRRNGSPQPTGRFVGFVKQQFR